MKRIVQTLGWVLGAALCVAVFVIAGRWSPTPLRWRDLGGWLDEVAVEDAVVEIARWAGIVVSGYVLVVAAVVLLAELAAAVRLVSIARVLRRFGSLSAIPVLRRRLLNVTTATAITVSSLSVAASNGVAAAPAAVTQTVDVPDVALPEGLELDAFDGFELASAEPPVAADAGSDGVDVVVQTGDKLWKLAEAHYGHIDRSITDELARINNIADPNLIHPGQTIHFPADLAPTPPPPPPPPPPVPEDAASWAVHRVTDDETLRAILEAHYGWVDADLVWTVAELNGITDPADLTAGTDLHLPPLDSLSGVDDDQAPIDEPAEPPPATDGEQPAEPPPATDGEQPAEPQPEPGDVHEPHVDEEPTTPDENADVPPPTTLTVTEAEPGGLTLVPDPPATTGEHGDESQEVSTTAPGVLPWVVGGAGSLVVATGLLEWLRRRRRARLAQSGSAWQIGPASEETPKIVTDVADLPLVEWAGAALARLMSDHDDDTVVVSVELDDTNLSVRWDRPRPAAPPPWWATDDGWSWHLERSSSYRPQEADRRVGVPGLVTFGARDDRHYLVNLEAAGSIEVDGPFTDEFVASLVVELAVGEVLSDATVQLVEMRLVGEGLLDTVAIVTGAEAAEQFTSTEPPDRLLVAIVESDDPVAAELVQQAMPGSRRVVIVLGGSELPTALDVTLTASGHGELAPSGATFTAARIPAALRALDPPTAPPPPSDSSAVRVEPVASTAVTGNVVSLNGRREQPGPPRVLLRLFAARLPALEPAVNGVGPLQMRIIAALDSFEGGKAPARIAERLGLAEKTVRTHAAPLFACDPPLVHSDREVWTLDDGVCSDVDWMHDLATTAREATTRHAAVRALAECWELLERVTGPAYAGGAESKQWAWVHDHTEGPSPSDNATRLLIEAVTIAVESWDTLIADDDQGLRSAASIIQTLLRLERAIGLVEPWPLFESAVKVARRGPESARQQIAMRLAQLAHNGEIAVPDDLVAEVVG